MTGTLATVITIAALALLASTAPAAAQQRMPAELVGEWCPVSKPRCRLHEGSMVAPTMITTWADGSPDDDEGVDPTMCEVKRIRGRWQLDLVCNGEGVEPDLKMTETWATGSSSVAKVTTAATLTHTSDASTSVRRPARQGERPASHHAERVSRPMVFEW